MNSDNYQFKLSIVIVNYNVEYFLEQCLNSVYAALSNVNAEIFVVDNNSVDGSVEMVKRRFPDVKLIENKANSGFSKANNQAIEQSNAEYVLLLNPDTVVEESTFEKIIKYMDSHENVGGLGVRMLDGKGNFLPESKRGLPTPAVAFYKIFGLSALFPKSKTFGKYHLGYLDEFETNEIEILSGAFMFMRMETLKKVGLLDETFFMYGEDIDLSYRIILGDYKNVYFPETNIIHYKGESTKKSSVNYVFVFYRAMVIFAKKHFSQKNAKLFSFLINTAIYFRAFLALVVRFVKKSFLPLTDFGIVLLGLLALTNQWRMAGILFPEFVFSTALPIYTFVWLICIFLSGGYDKPIKIWSFLKGSMIGLGLILVIYALIPKEWQFSRLYILSGTAYTFFYFVISRLYLKLALPKKFQFNVSQRKNFAIVGSLNERLRVSEILTQTTGKAQEITHVEISNTENPALNSLSQLDQIILKEKIDEIIFCAKDVSAKEIIYWMSLPTNKAVDYKIAQPDGYYLIGSNSIDTAGDLYKLNINTITNAKNTRNKRLFDLVSAFLLLLASPFIIWLYDSKRKYFSNIFSVLANRKTMVGYAIENNTQYHGLPKIKTGVLEITEAYKNDDLMDKDKINLIYARDYSILTDFKILSKYWKNIDC